MATIASNAAAFSNILLAFGVRDYVDAVRPKDWQVSLTTEARLQADIRALNDPDLLSKWLTRVELRIRVDPDPATAMRTLQRVRGHAVMTIRYAWPHLLRHTKIGLRKFFRAYFAKLNQLENELLWSGVENL